jgi:ribose transport system substrate-binding protein
VRCLFTGSPEADEIEQHKVIRDLIARMVDGIAIAPNNPETIAPLIAIAQAKGIPVITFDSDAPKSKRSAFVGTNNLQGGAEAGKVFKASLPKGGKYAIITGGLAADNLNDRIEGFKSALGSGFTEVDGSPFPCDDDPDRALTLIEDALKKNPDLDGLFFSGGWPMYDFGNYAHTIRPRQDDIRQGRFVVVSYDNVEAQLKALKAGLVTALIGQRPYNMGVQSIDVLMKLSAKQKAPTVIDTGVDVVTSENVDKFSK